MATLLRFQLQHVTVVVFSFLNLVKVANSLAVPQPVKNPTPRRSTGTRDEEYNYHHELSADLLAKNQKRHEAAVQGCESIYPFRFTKEDFDSDKIGPVTEWEQFSFFKPDDDDQDSAAFDDEWPRHPFGSQDLARISQQPLLTKEECALLMEEVDEKSSREEWMEGGSRYGTPDDRVGALMPLERLPKSYELINERILPRLFSNICSSTGFGCLQDPSSLRLGGARIVKYDAAAGQVELGFHRDFLLLTANLALNNPDTDFTDGGTIVEAVSSKPIRLDTGHALLHPGDVRHAAAPITSGKRYVLVLFIMDANTIPHDRYLAEYGERAMMLACQEEDMDGKNYLLSKAAQLYSDAFKSGGRMDRGIFPWFYHRAGAGAHKDVA